MSRDCYLLGEITVPQLDRSGVFVRLSSDFRVSGLSTCGASVLVPFTKLNADQLDYVAAGLRAQLFKFAGVEDPQAPKETHET